MINHLTNKNNIPTRTHFTHGVKNQELWIKKLNGEKKKKKKKKKKKIKKKKKKKKKFNYFYKEKMILESISEIKDLTFQYPKVSVGILLDFSN